MEYAILYSILYSYQKISVKSSFSSSVFHNYHFRIFYQLLHLPPILVTTLLFGVFVFFAYFTCLLAFLAINNLFYSLAAFIFVAFCISYGRFINVGFSLICLSAVIDFVVDLLVLAFL